METKIACGVVEIDNIMRIAVTGMPRCRTTEILNIVKNHFALTSLNNKWGELQLSKDDEKEFIHQDNIIVKLWPIHHDNIFDILKTFDHVFFSFTNNTNLWLLKIFNSTLENNKFSLDLKRDIKKYSLNENIGTLKEMVEYYKIFKEYQHNYFSQLNLVYKTVFINEQKVFSHIHNNMDQNLIKVLQEKLSINTKRNYRDYVTQPEKVNEIIKQVFDI